MKVTIKFDESAGLKPSEVKVKQAASEYARRANRNWAEYFERVEFAPLVMPLAAVWPENGGAK